MNPAETPPADARGPNARRALTRCVRFVAAGYLFAVLLMSFLERYLVYPAPPVGWGDWSASESDDPAAPEDAWIDSTDGVLVHGWFYGQTDASRAVLYCHGNGEQVADNHALMRTIRRELDAAVLIFDYRGYGKTKDGGERRPKPSERGVIADGVAAQRWLAQRVGVEPTEVVVVGRSLGGGVATALAAEMGCGGLILQDTFTRLTDAAASHYPWLPVSWVMRNRYDTLSRIAGYEGPLVVSHAGRDQVVPFAHGKRLFEACPSPNKRFLPQPKRGHEDPLPKDYWAAVREVLDNPEPARGVQGEPPESGAPGGTAN